MVVRSGGRNVPLPGPSVRALLGALLLGSGHIVSEDRLLELAWGGEGKAGERCSARCTGCGRSCAARRLAPAPPTAVMDIGDTKGRTGPDPLAGTGTAGDTSQRSPVGEV
jgi:hypothetical protein